MKLYRIDEICIQVELLGLHSSKILIIHKYTYCQLDKFMQYRRQTAKFLSDRQLQMFLKHKKDMTYQNKVIDNRRKKATIRNVREPTTPIPTNQLGQTFGDCIG